MGATVALGDVVGKAEQVLVETVVPLQCHFYANTILTLNIEVEDFVHRGLVGVQIGDEGTETTIIFEQLFLGITLVAQSDADARVKEGKFAQTLGQDVRAEVNVLEGLRGRLEMNLGP